MDFYQEPPAIGSNQFLNNNLLISYLKWKIPNKYQKEIFDDLSLFGEKVSGPLLEWSKQAEKNPPELVQFDSWGKRIDHIEVSEGWKNLEKFSAEEGLIAIGYERKQKEFSRLYQMAKLFLFHPSSAFFSCPLAMTDGATRLIELYQPRAAQHAFTHLTSRDPQKFWTSGQWMTERTGGSDVGGTSTIAKQKKDHCLLYGDKFFTSATTSQMAMMLARVEGDSEGSRGLSLFFAELKDKNGEYNNLQVNRLKDKLGTKALPTAELTLSGMKAHLLGEQGKGVKSIAPLLNITRLYNTICALSASQRILTLITDYARKRNSLGRPLQEHPLHVETLANLECELWLGFFLSFELAFLLGKEESDIASQEDKAILRLLVPIAKLFTAKESVKHVSEGLESIGGAGYIEDTDFPRHLRDAQVFSIWEGTTNILSLDVLRVLAKEGTWALIAQSLESRVDKIDQQEIQQKARRDIKNLNQIILQMAEEGSDFSQAGARSLSFSIGKVCAYVFMAEALGHWQDGKKLEIILKRWTQRELISFRQTSEDWRKESSELVFG